MKLAYLSTSLPMQCGLATFNNNLQQAINTTDINHTNSIVIAFSDSDDRDAYSYPEEVKFIVRKDVLEDYAEVANYLNDSAVDACILQHEFGIFGGNEGLFILNLLSRLNKPVITIMHTVLKNPNYIQLSTIQQIAKFSKKVIVMSHKAISMLIAIYNIPKEKLEYIAHGVPNLEPKNTNPIKLQHPFKNQKVLLTFGLISRGKGIETVIKAMPQIIEKHPNAVYVVLGNTHPGIIKNAGEEYRDSLKELAKHLNVEQNVIFINKFVTEDELFDYLTATDIYITPYLNEEQITSGTLSYAVGAGCAVVSTPYWHASELLKDNRGLLFDFKNSKQLANIVTDLLNDPNLLSKFKENAYQYGLNLRWPAVAQAYLNIVKQIKNSNLEILKSIQNVIYTDQIPVFNIDHVKRLTDYTGIIQHATYGIPNLKEGYCLDDNARALLMSALAHKQFNDQEALNLLPTYLSYIQYIQNEDGSFKNFLSFDKKFLDEVGSEDSYGRTIWALGYMIGNAPNNSYKEFATELFLKSLPHIPRLEHLRGWANTLIGICLYLKANPNKIELVDYLHLLLNKIVKAYQNNKSQNWHWFEDKLTYDNAIIPLSLWYSYEYLKDSTILNIAQESQAFLTKHTFANGYFNPVGNQGWLYKNKEMAEFDQQAIETMGMVILLYKSFKLTKNNTYLYNLNICFQWFLGTNSLGISLYDEETKGCGDGLQSFGVNRNQGAESTLAYLIAYIYTFKGLELEYNDENQSTLKTNLTKA